MKYDKSGFITDDQRAYNDAYDDGYDAAELALGYKQQPLTDDEISAIWKTDGYEKGYLNTVRLIEQAHGIGVDDAS